MLCPKKLRGLRSRYNMNKVEVVCVRFLNTGIILNSSQFQNYTLFFPILELTFILSNSRTNCFILSNSRALIVFNSKRLTCEILKT